MAATNLPALTLGPEQMREFGYRVVDALISHLGDLPDSRLRPPRSPAELDAAIDTRMRREPTPPEAVLDELLATVVPDTLSVQHPRFFAFVPSPGNFVSVMADTLASGTNAFANTWLEGSGPVTTELALIDWLRNLFAMPASAGGFFTSGGSMANVTALAAARHDRLDDEIDGAVVYASEQTHSSLPRGLKLLGFRPHQYHQLPTDAEYRLDLSSLRQQIAADAANGLRPFCVIANAGTTNTGAVDPLESIADICSEHDLWLHADAAYGGAAILAGEGRRALRGLDRVDSMSLDPHKWLFQPYEIGCVLVRDRTKLRDAFFTRPDYLADTAGADDEVNLCEYGPELTRGYRALKLWMSLRVFGVDAFERAIDRGLQLARLAANTVDAMPDWTVCAPPSLGIVAFRFHPADLTDAAADQRNLRLVDDLLNDGFAFVTSSRLGGQVVLRMCTINPRTSDADVVRTLQRLDELARRPL